MEERRLNLNTPLLSVRRNLSSAGTLTSLKLRTAENSRQKIRNGNCSMDPVTEPVSVPFTWEQVPGRAKDDGECEVLLANETLPATPVLAARNSMSVYDDCLEKEFRDISQMEKGLVVTNKDDDVYSDAVDTMSLTGSVSIGCNMSGLSGSDGHAMKRSGTFSADTLTRDFMMGRFLPAARAMAMASESSLHCTSRNRHLLLTEQPHDVEQPQASAIKSRTPSRQHNMEIMQYFTQALPQTESSEEEEEEEEVEGGAAANEDHGRYNRMPGKGCGLLPQLCFRSSLRLLNPVPGLKSRIKNSMTFVPAIRKYPKGESIGRSLENFNLPVLHVQSAGAPQKSEDQIGNPNLEGDLGKPLGWSSRLNFSGDLRKIGRLSPFRSRINDVTAAEKSEPLHPALVVPPLGGSRRVNLSGELRPTSRKSSPFRLSRKEDAIFEKHESPRTSHVVSPCRGSGRPKLSGELRMTGGLSPFRPPRNDIAPSRANLSGELRMTGGVSPFRSRRNDVASCRVNSSGELRMTGGISPFRPPRNDVASSQVNLSDELRITRRLSPFRDSRNDAVTSGLSQTTYVVPTLVGLSPQCFSGELRTSSQLSPFRQESSQTSCVVPSVGWSSRRNFSGELQTPRGQFPIRPLRNRNTCTTLQKNESMPSAGPTFERILYVDKVTTGCNSCSDSNSLNREALMDPVAEEIAAREVECLKAVIREETSKEVDNSVLDPSLPIPSLRSPSQSWLWCTLPSIGSARSRFPSPQKTRPLSPMKHNSDKCRADAKWETIVKTSKTYHDHTRYSEELIEHVSRQCKS
ncbi:hypothetical protein MLD38_021181 [Melastoma candidum]|uniref:Uncharacterized protein n=1 Tax=Melastoma candidum TaxID=119954 RepID=A0ACB9QFB7_9MYRT|nr:hypothetical protein MLD38_021181 [Melastoma candidum]